MNKDLKRFAALLGVIITSGFLLAPQNAARGGDNRTATGGAWSELTTAMQTMHSEMASARSSGDSDVDFVRVMVPHHRAALDMAKAELLHGRDPELRRLAQEIVADQQSEIELMNLWLKCRGGETDKRAKGRPSNRTEEVNGELQ
jgi:hypothetical protein